MLPRINTSGKSLWLTVASVILLFVFSNIPGYSEWLTRIGSYYKDANKREIGKYDEGYRNIYRAGHDYLMSRFFAMNLAKLDDPVLLLPPKEYLSHFIQATTWAEPRGFYYYVGDYKTVTLEHPDVKTATHTIVFNEKMEPQLLRINHAYFDEMVEHFRNPQPISVDK